MCPAKEITYDGCDRCPDAFASVFDSLLTFIQTILAGDSWGQVSLLVSNLSTNVDGFPTSFLDHGQHLTRDGQALQCMSVFPGWRDATLKKASAMITRLGAALEI